MYYVRLKFIIIAFVVLFVTLYVLRDFTYTRKGRKSTIDEDLNHILNGEQIFEEYSSPIEPFKQIIIHLDLKGAPPKVSYLLNFIPFVKKLGATGLLLEYEDMFPYHDELEDIKADNAYTLSEIGLINEAAERNNMTVIPLVQTFGHFEFVLKVEKYRSFREVPTDPQSLCPSQRNITNIIQKMISQVLDAHPRSQYFHMGCDEVKYVGICPKCRTMMKKNKWRKDDIYFLHVKKVARYITRKNPSVRPIIWGDQFSKKNEELILSHDIPQLVDIMLWNYKTDSTYYPKASDMNAFARLFDSIWIASSFKGSQGKSKMIPIPLKHYINNKGWKSFAAKWRDKIKFKGVALTGWQRYDHFSVLCELLPVAIPSLAISVQALTEERGSNFLKIEGILECNNMPPLTTDDLKDLKMFSELQCKFLGFDVYYHIHFIDAKIKQIRTALNVFKTEDLFLYNVLSNFSVPSFIRRLGSENTFKKYFDELNELEHKTKLALAEVYDENTITEWMMTYVLPFQLRLEAAMRILQDLSAQKSWSKRPFSDSETSFREFFKTICGPLERRGCALLNIN